MLAWILPLLAAGPLFAQQPASSDGDASPLSPPPPAGEEIVIEADADLAQARGALDAAIMDLGYGTPRRRRDRTVYPRDLGSVWKPKVVVYDNGLVTVRQRSITPLMVMPDIQRDDEGELESVTAEAVGLASGKRTKQRMEATVVEAITPQLRSWRDAMARRHLADRRSTLREELAAAWFDGVDPQGRPLATHAERRAWMIAAWLNTADNDAGETVRRDIERFLGEVVQRSEHPLTEDELAAANQARAFPEALDP